MKSKKYFVNAVWTDPADWGRILFRRLDNNGIGYTRLEAMRMCVRLTGEGKYCSVKELRKEKVMGDDPSHPFTDDVMMGERR